MMMIRRIVIWMIVLLAGMATLAATGARPDAPNGPLALQLEIEGTIGPVTAQYFRSGLHRAGEAGASMLLLRIDTPGGLDAAMRDIVKDILAAPIPVICHVAPGGARAASAGTYILYACHVAAMAPATNLGSATPVQIGGFPGLPDDPSEPQQDQPELPEGEADPAAEQSAQPAREESSGAMDRKIINDAAAFIRGLAALRGRDAEWAERAVRVADNLTAEEALQRSVIDLLAADSESLLSAVDGRVVTVLGEQLTLDTEDVRVERFEPDWRTRILSVITDPNIAYVLMIVGIYGLIYELANPGAIVPGVVGTIALLTALYAFQALPVNYAGLALLVLGIAFMVLEVFVPSFGALGIGGATAFVFGSIILYRDESGQIGVAIPVILTFAALSMALFIGVIGYALKTRSRAVVSGREQMLHAVGVAAEDFVKSGRVHVHSEIWNAQTRRPLHKGQQVRVTDLQGLTLIVEPLDADRQE